MTSGRMQVPTSHLLLADRRFTIVAVKPPSPRQRLLDWLDSADIDGHD